MVTLVRTAIPVALVVPAAERYWTDPVKVTLSGVGLYSSTNLSLYVAPAEPALTYASLITRPLPAGLARAVWAATGSWEPVTAKAPETRAASRARRCDRDEGMKDSERR